MRCFVAVAEAGSFNAGAARVGISPKLASKYLGLLEGRVGAPLLYRTTRALSLTEQGAAYLIACRKVLAAAEEAEAALHPGSGLQGRLRISAPVTFGEVFVAGAVRGFLGANPGLRIALHLSDRLADLAAEGFDMAVRIGNLRDSGLIARRLATTEVITAASPGWLAAYGPLRHPDALAGCDCIIDLNGTQPERWDFVIEGRRASIQVAGRFAVNSASSAIAAGIAGEGVIRCPDVFLTQPLADGRLVRVLAGYPGPVLDIQTVHLPTAFRQPKIAALHDFLRARLRAGQAAVR